MAKYPLSVTAKPCRCESLARHARDPQSPIVFDEKAGEYNFEYDGKNGKGSLRIRHCPFCGGVVPTTLAAQKFENISPVESARLHDLVAHFKTLEEAIQVLGPPDESTPTLERAVRTLTYQNLSKVATVALLDSIDGVPKYLLIHKIINRPKNKKSQD